MFDVKEYRKEYYQKNKEIIKERTRSNKIKNIERYRELARRHYLANKEEYLARSRSRKRYKNEYYQRNKERAKEYLREYRKTDKGRYSITAYNNNRRILTRGMTQAIVQEVYENNIKTFGTLTCYLCLEKIIFGDDSIDHKIPISKGGGNNIDNLAIAHIHCNSRKGAKIVY